MKKSSFTLAILAVVLLLAAAALASETYVPPPDSQKPARVTAQSVYALKCSKCHAITRPDGKTKTPDEWKATVEQMRNKDQKWISADEAGTITAFLSGRALCSQKCTKCHSAERVDVKKTAVQWQSTVQRMQAKKPDWISDDEKKQILFYLTDTQLLELE
jgi:cytochrome c2